MRAGLLHGQKFLQSKCTAENETSEKVHLTIKEAVENSNIGINRIEELLKMSSCSFVLYMGKKKLVKGKEIEHFKQCIENKKFYNLLLSLDMLYYHRY